MRRPSFDMRSVLSAVGCALCIGSVLLAPLAASQPTLLADAVRLGAQDERVPTISLDRTTLLKQVTLVRDPFVEPADVASRLKFERVSNEGRRISELLLYYGRDLKTFHRRERRPRLRLSRQRGSDESRGVADRRCRRLHRSLRGTEESRRVCRLP